MVLSYFLEKFVRRIAGRWVREGEISMSMGRIEVSDVWLETKEVRKMLLPFEVTSAHASKICVDLASFRVDVDDVDVILETTDEADEEAARRAVEIAIHLYFTNYLRETPKSGEPSIDTIVDAFEFRLTRAHVKVRSKLPLFALGDGRGPLVVWGLLFKELAVRRTSKMRKTIDLTDVVAYYTPPPHHHHQGSRGGGGGRETKNDTCRGRPKDQDDKDQDDKDDDAPRSFVGWVEKVDDRSTTQWQESLSSSLGGGTTRTYECRCNDRVFEAAALSVEVEASLDTSALKLETRPDGDAFTPWLSTVHLLKLAGRGVRLRVDDEVPAVVLDALRRLRRSHASRQELACRVFGERRREEEDDLDDEEDPRHSFHPQGPRSSSSSSSLEVERCQRSTTSGATPTKKDLETVGKRLWAVARAAVHRDLWTAQRKTWRRWFREWVDAARYVALRRRLETVLRCGVFKAQGEAFYDLHETCGVTRGGKFYVHPAQLSKDEEEGRQRNGCRRRRRDSDDNDDPSAEDPAAAALDARTALSLYARQLYADAMMPVPVAATLRAFAKKKKFKETNAAPLLLIAPALAGHALPISSYFSSELVVDVEVVSGATSTNGRCNWTSTDGKVFQRRNSLLELPVVVVGGGGVELKVRVVDVAGPYESTVATTELRLRRRHNGKVEAQRKVLETRPVVVDLAFVEEEKTTTGMSKLRLGLSYCDVGEASVGRKKFLAAKTFNDDDTQQKKKKKKGQLLKKQQQRKKTKVDAVRVELEDVEIQIKDRFSFVAGEVRGEASSFAVPSATVGRPAGTGQGAILAALGRFLERGLADNNNDGGLLWRATDATFELHSGFFGCKEEEERRKKTVGGAVVECRRRRLRRKKTQRGETQQQPAGQGGRRVLAALAPNGALLGSSCDDDFWGGCYPRGAFVQGEQTNYFSGGTFELAGGGSTVALHVDVAPPERDVAPRTLPALLTVYAAVDDDGISDDDDDDTPLFFPLPAPPPAEDESLELPEDEPLELREAVESSDDDDDVDACRREKTPSRVERVDIDDAPAEKTTESRQPLSQPPPAPKEALLHADGYSSSESSGQPTKPEENNNNNNDDDAVQVRARPVEPETVDTTCLKALGACAIQ